MKHFALPLLALVPALLAQDTVGRELSPWQPGMLEIHQISTGRGNSGLYIFPDGTTMLVDAGENARKTPRHTPDRPDTSHPAGEWIARYIRHALRHEAQPALDYVLLTHFHGDHMGDPSDGSPASKSGAYKLTGLTYVGESFKFGKLMDRGWPDYSYPALLQDRATANYRAFVKWQTERNGLKVERFAPGRNDQVVLLRDAKKYPDFEFRNIGANGEVWTGVGTATRKHFPLLDAVPRADWPSENMCSTSFRLSYGKFDYFNGADIPGIPSRLHRFDERISDRHAAPTRVDAFGMGLGTSDIGGVAPSEFDTALPRTARSLRHRSSRRRPGRDQRDRKAGQRPRTYRPTGVARRRRIPGDHRGRLDREPPRLKGLWAVPVSVTRITEDCGRFSQLSGPRGLRQRGASSS
jgi:hypothetical protein